MLRGTHPSTAPREVQGHTGTRRDAHNSQPQPRGCRTARERGVRPPPTARSWKSPHHSLQGYKQWGESRRLCSCRREELTEAAGRGEPPNSAPLPCSLGGAGRCPTVHSRRGAGAACAWMGAGAEVRAEHQSTCVPLPWHRAGAEGTTLGGEAALLQSPLPQPPREGLAAPQLPSPRPPSSSKPSSSPCPQNRATSLDGPSGNSSSPAPPCQREQGGSWQPRHIQTTPYLSMSPPSFSLK